MKKLLCLFLFCGAAAFFMLRYAQTYVETLVPLENEVTFQVKKGDSLVKIADTLWQNKLIKEKWHFILYCKINKIYPQVKAGEYLVKDEVSIKKLADVLTEGKFLLRKITFPEGLTSREIKVILDNNEFLEGDYEDFSEGEILPETYTFSRGESRQHIVTKAKQALQEVLNKAWESRDGDLNVKSKEELLVLASIVEKETGVDSERAKVASVFANRLKKGMLLQTDPTVIYAITLGKEDLNRPLYYRDLEIDSPYNTYKYVGLPPKPICNPGKDAIMAAANPEKTSYLYFVASGTGGHNFAKTLAEHNDNVRKWRKLNK